MNKGPVWNLENKGPVWNLENKGPVWNLENKGPGWNLENVIYSKLWYISQLFKPEKNHKTKG